MPARTGEQFLKGLRGSREVWVDGERIADVADHPKLRGAAHALADVYDLHHKHADICLAADAETGEAISYGELDAASNRAAQLFRAHGLGHEDVVAFMLDNTPHYYGLTWGAQRSGLRYVCISSRLTQDETDYILENSGAQILVV